MITLEILRRSLRSYKVQSQVAIAAPCERVYAIATDPSTIPRFSREIASLELLGPPGPVRRARCRIRVCRIPIPAAYLYRYRAGRAYAGMQTGSPIARSFFAFGFQRDGGATRVTHIEGFHSRVPLLAMALGLVYFHVLSRGGLRTELLLLKSIAESAGCDAPS